ncbi:MAG: hypothetical protein R3D05_09990 [Dongiaceae bacterium]
MSSDKPESPKHSHAPANPAQRAEQDRLAAALRDNLKRRKDQARARREPEPGRRDG